MQNIDATITENMSILPEKFAKQWKLLNTKAADEAEIKAKLKLKIPIIPSILEYENEFSVDLKKVAQKLRSYLF